MNKKLKNILIVGGGSAGWMSAATMIKKFPNLNITLIESPNIATMGVGESTIGGIRNWTNWLGIDDREFLKHTDGSYKLSIKFTDFYKKNGEHFHYPFGSPVIENNTVGVNDWWFKKFNFPETKNSDYATSHYPQMALVNGNKCFFNENNEIPFNFKKDTAFHFDATKFALWLKDHYCLPRGVNHIKENIDTIEFDDEGIKSVNEKYQADLYIDCTGFKSLLLDKSLQEPFESYEDMLPNNSAWATRIPYIDKEKQLETYTNCTAIENGWVWNIPLWSRIGTGYVYSDKFVSDEEALEQLKNHLRKNGNDTNNLEFKNIKMRIGIHNRLWVKNVVAIGLSAGFIEPLESNGLFTVHEFLIRLIRNLNRENISQWDRDNFNYDCKSLFRNFAEFVAMHYSMSHRDDTEYWRNNLNKEWNNDILDFKSDLKTGFTTAILQRTYDYYFPHNEGLHCIAAGMNYSPIDEDFTDYYNSHFSKSERVKNENIFIERMNKRSEQWQKIVKDKPSLYEFLKGYIYNE